MLNFNMFVSVLCSVRFLWFGKLCPDVHPATVILEELTPPCMFPDFILFLKYDLFLYNSEFICEIMKKNSLLRSSQFPLSNPESQIIVKSLI